MAWGIFIDFLIGKGGADRRETADVHHGFNLFSVLDTTSVKRNAHPRIVMEVFMSVFGTGDTGAMKDIIHGGETILICFGLVEISGVQDDARRVEPLQVAGFTDHAMDLTSAFQQSVDHVAADKSGGSGDQR